MNGRRNLLGNGTVVSWCSKLGWLKCLHKASRIFRNDMTYLAISTMTYTHTTLYTKKHDQTLFARDANDDECPWFQMEQDRTISHSCLEMFKCVSRKQLARQPAVKCDADLWLLKHRNPNQQQLCPPAHKCRLWLIYSSNTQLFHFSIYFVILSRRVISASEIVFFCIQVNAPSRTATGWFVDRTKHKWCVSKLD